MRSMQLADNSSLNRHQSLEAAVGHKPLHRMRGQVEVVEE
jgi:hypothetical protein